MIINKKLTQVTKGICKKIIDQDYKFYIQVFNEDVPNDEIRLYDLKYISTNDLMVKLREFFYKYRAMFKLENSNNQIRLTNNQEIININFILEKEGKLYKISDELENVFFDYIEAYSELFVSVISNDNEKLLSIVNSSNYHNTDKKYVLVWGITEGKYELIEQLIPIIEDVVFDRAIKNIHLETLEVFDHEMAKIVNQRLKSLSHSKIV
ncbi:hypothetical protein KHQ81_15820 (plasmid) [Mycoplasmatota bacterium]|nr:hypothetical protein KHQ81_15820 [Mycoplasmatota bacterium]